MARRFARSTRDPVGSGPAEGQLHDALSLRRPHRVGTRRAKTTPLCSVFANFLP